jgi:hypothetical protein
MIGWPFAFASVVKLHIMVGAHGIAKLLISWEVKESSRKD